MQRHFLLTICLMSILFLQGCANLHAHESSSSYEAQGTASWYGKKFQRKKTASGERFDMHQMTAAHRTLPLSSHVLVTNLRNGKKVAVKINDRGPFTHHRLIDLSYAAAKRLGFTGQGTAKVAIKRISAAEAKRVNA
ncbi:MAG: septal ring lytic transglycosylase RlpA family protein [Gammaproteobacteria bacterium]